MSQTKAETKARRMAELLESTGQFEVTVTVEQDGAEYYSDGDVMCAPKVVVHVNAREKGLFGDSLGLTWVSYLPAKGHRASTRFVYANLLRSFGKSRQLNLKQTWSYISCEVDMARYRKQREAQQAAAHCRSHLEFRSDCDRCVSERECA